MRPFCVICQELFVISAQISACNCGHVFHEECLFRWLKSHQTCPQCRAKVTESTVIKRLFLTECDSSTQVSTTSDELSSSQIGAKYEEFLNKIEELKHNLREKSDLVNTKTKALEQKDNKIKELEDTKTNFKKKLSENQLLIDYLKKELENYNSFKEKYDLKEKFVFELESKLKEFKLIDLIYKDHENAFENEMKKILSVPLTNLSHSQTIVRQLVSTNVLLKEQLDKQTEDKKILRKKLFQMEKVQSEKEQSANKKEQELKELQEKYKKIQQNYANSLNKIKTMEDKFQSLDSLRESPKWEPSNATSSPMIQSDDSDIQFLDHVGKMEASIERKKNEEDESPSTQAFASPIMRKRKNPFAKSESFPSLDINIPSYQEPAKKFIENNHKKLTISQILEDSDSDSNTDIDLVKPIAKQFKKTTSDITKKTVICIDDSLSGDELKPLSNANKIGEAKSSSNGAKSSSGFSYQFDGLGGRKKIFSNENSSKPTLLSSVLNKNAKQKLTKFKVTR